MIIVNKFVILDAASEVSKLTIELPYDLRKKSRLRTETRCGQEVGIQLPRGSELLDGQCLVADDGTVVEVVASAETVSTATADDPLLLLRAAYHLGNRHMPLQITDQWLRYQHDHVLDEMVLGLGLKVAVEAAPFQPESGAYHRHGDGAHNHNHSHAHSDHDHSPEQNYSPELNSPEHHHH